MDAAAPDLCIFNGTVVSMNAGHQVFSPGMVCAGNGAISYVGPQSQAPVQAAAAPPGCTVVDADGGLIIPGLINTHTHVSMSVFRTLADDMADRLKRYLFPLESRFVTPDLVYWGALHSLHEMIRGGTTTFADMYYFEEQVAEAAESAGIRAVLGETVVNFPAPDAPDPYGGIEYFKRFAHRYQGNSLITPCLAPHAPYTLSDEHLSSIAALATEYDLPVMSHLAEMEFEVSELASKYGETPVEYYRRVGLLNQRLIAAHCVHVTPSDIALLADSDCGIAHNPIANMKGGKGAAPLPSFLENKLRVGLGTDGPMSGNTMDMLHVASTAAKVHKMVARDRTLVPAEAAFELATMGGARALHMEDRIGSLEPGKRADIAVVSLDAPHMFPVYDPYAVLVYCAGPQDVRHVFVEGRQLLRDYLPLTMDTVEIRRQVGTIVKGVRAGLRDL